MSRRRKRRAVRSQQNAAPNKAQLPAETVIDTGSQTRRMLEALDGYSNSVAYLGENSPLISAGTYHRSGLTSNPMLLTTTYREFWLATRIIDMPADDVTRAWYKLTGNFSEEEMEELRKTEARHSIKREITDAIRWARLYGGALALMVIRGEEGRLDQPLDLDLLMPECFQGLLVLDRAQGIEPSMELEEDLDDPDFGLPKYYTAELTGAGGKTVRIHHSRVLRFVGRELPRLEMISENYWGASELEHMWDELQKRSSTSANIAQLVFQANITTLKMGLVGEEFNMGTDRMRERILETMAMENRVRTSYGLQLLGKEDSLENHSYSFAGLRDVYEAFMMDVAGAAEIPATKLFGRAPEGFQATGESDLRNYYEMISGLQERLLRPALERLLPVMTLSCWGYVPENLNFVFNPIAAASPADLAELATKLAMPVIEAFKAGMIGREEAVAELKARGEPYGFFTRIGG